jgi:RND family efflux transporter MFP subunit
VRFRRWIWVALPLVLVAAVFFLLRASHEGVDVADVTRGPAVEAVYATATVEPLRWVKVAPLKTGRIVDVLVEEGYRVGLGVLLARMDDSDLRAQLAEAQSAVRFGQTEMGRAESLLRSRTISQDRYDAAKTDLERAQARQKTLEEQIEQLSLKSPIEGKILWRDVEPGEIKQSGEPIFWVGEPSPLRLKAEVDEQDIPKIRPGQRVVISADAFPDQPLFAEVTSITPKGDPESKSYRVYAEIPSKSPLMIGMTVETNTITAYHKDAFLVPASSLIEGPAVWVVREEKAQRAGTLRKVPVKTFIRGEQRVEVSGDLTPGDKVVLAPSVFLRDGDRVKIRSVLSSPAADEIAQTAILTDQGELKPDGSVAGCRSGCSGCANKPAQSGDDVYTKIRKDIQATKQTCYPEVKTLLQKPDSEAPGSGIPVPQTP